MSYCKHGRGREGCELCALERATEKIMRLEPMDSPLEEVVGKRKACSECGKEVRMLSEESRWMCGECVEEMLAGQMASRARTEMEMEERIEEMLAERVIGDGKIKDGQDDVIQNLQQQLWDRNCDTPEYTGQNGALKARIKELESELKECARESSEINERRLVAEHEADVQRKLRVIADNTIFSLSGDFDAAIRENASLKKAVAAWKVEESEWVKERAGMLGEIAYLNGVADEDVAIRIGGERNHLEGEVKLLDEDNKRLREERDGYMKALDAIRKARDGFLNA